MAEKNYVNLIFWLIVGLIVFAFLQDLSNGGNPYDCPDSDPTQYTSADC